VTAASEPILHGSWIRPGTHLNVVGSSIAAAREIDSEAVARSRFYVDLRESTTKQGGEYLTALREGAIGENHIVGEIGEVLTSAVPGRSNDDEITLFKSLGIAVEDLISARHVYDGAVAQNRGVEVEF
jgi:ornithine cyclodeaminase